VDNEPLTLVCPGNIIISTDPGGCCATHTPPIIATDNCGPVSLTCALSGATTGQGPTACFNLGVTIVNCVATALDGSASGCNFNVRVDDGEAPTIICPADVYVTVPGCSDGQNVSFPPAMATDNCGVDKVTCDFDSGDFFPCGPTTVTCTAEDINGNVNDCTFQINVNGCNQCAEIISSGAVCGALPNTYEFTVMAQNLTSVPFPNATVTATSSSGTISNPIWDSSTGTMTGTITIVPPATTNLNVDLIFDFPCQFGNIVCTLMVTMNTPCCEEVTIDDNMFCSEDGTAYIPLNGCSSLFNVQQVNWYYAYTLSDGSCPSPPFSPLVWNQINPTSNPCDDLLILPNYLSGDICVYAEVIFSSGPCQVITSNIAQITFCAPIGCSISGAKDYCDDGTPFTVDALTVTPNSTDCVFTFQWFDGNGNAVPGATTGTYQPGPLPHVAGSNEDCFTTYTFSVEITSLCGTQTCTASIHVYNANAPIGMLEEYYPAATMPYCPGQDATLEYTEQCVGPTPYSDTWNWYISNSGTNGPWAWLDLSGGTVSNFFNTNQLFQDTWYKVEKTNGACPLDSIKYFIDLLSTATINSFTAAEDNPCTPSTVVMDVDFFTECTAGVTIDWYKDGDVVSTSNHTSSPANFTYNSPALEGNYYIVVTDNCCGEMLKSEVVIIEKSWTAIVSGPCFRCNDQPVTLEGMVLDVPTGVTCTYQWYKDGFPLLGETGLNLTVNEADATYSFKATCDQCIKTVDYFLMQCGEPNICVCAELVTDVNMGFSFNPVGIMEYQVKPLAPLQSCDVVTWNWGDGETGTTIGSAALNHQYINSTPTNLCMTVLRTQANNDTCSHTSCMMVTDINTVSENARYMLYPNPSNGIFTLYSTGISTIGSEFQVYDSKGLLVFTMDLEAQQRQYPVSMTELPAGVYFLKVMDDGVPVWVEKLVKE
jgi:hypothetical protein